MGIQQSNLSSTGFDYVVAVSQDSVNAALEQYLYYGDLKETILCYVYESATSTNIVPIDFATFVASANNTNPFTIPANTDSSDPRVQNLANANFVFAIKARLGLPPGIIPAKLPPIVALKPGQSNVTYTMMFSEFVGTEIIYGARGRMTWVNVSQSSGKSWTFSGAVDLDFQDASFNNLPPAVQNQLNGIGDPNDFSVQQLYYDLNSSDLEQTFQFDNVPSNSNLNTFMTANFVDAYWKALGGNEVLGYGAKQQSSIDSSALAVTNLNFFTPDAVGTENAPLMLNYLCALNNNSLPDTTHAGFGWNWLEPKEVAQYSGVAALNRNTLARYLNNAPVNDFDSLYDYVCKNCYQPTVQVKLDGTACDYNWNMLPNQTPTLSYPPTGNTLLKYSYNSTTADDKAGSDGAVGEMKLSSSFDLSVSVQGKTPGTQQYAKMEIVQHLVVWCYIYSLGASGSGNIIDIQITDTYEFSVDDNGKIILSTPSAKATPPTSVTVDKSQSPGVNGFLNFFTDLNALMDGVKQWLQSVTTAEMKDVSLSNIQNFIFPGGNTFSFSDVDFSNNQDLVSHITYGDVSKDV